jgi:hypothetical protein
VPDSITFYGVRDQNSAGNAALNVRGSETVTFVFRTSGTGGNLVLSQVPDDSDPDTLPEVDPNTKIVINGVEYNFAVLLTGTLPTTNPNGAQRVPDNLEGEEGMLIKVDIDGDGLDADDPQYFFTLNGEPPVGTWGNGAVSLGGTDTTPPDEPVCFCRGTEIATPSGPRMVESLRSGDVVLTANGAAVPIIWTGRTRISLAELLADADLRPICIPANALAPGLPKVDLSVSPQHRVLFEGPACELLFGEPSVLVPAKHLVATLAEVQAPTGEVEYFHILLQDHDMLVSNGLATESFQPARRSMDVMGPVARIMLEAVIAALGEADLLTRKDRHLSLKEPEARVLLRSLAMGRDRRIGRMPDAERVSLSH